MTTPKMTPEALHQLEDAGLRVESSQVNIKNPQKRGKTRDKRDGRKPTSPSSNQKEQEMSQQAGPGTHNNNPAVNSQQTLDAGAQALKEIADNVKELKAQVEKSNSIKRESLRAGAIVAGVVTGVSVIFYSVRWLTSDPPVVPPAVPVTPVMPMK